MSSTRRPRPRPLRPLVTLVVLVIALIGTILAGTRFSDATATPQLALDLEGGTQLILTPRTTDGSQVTSEDIDQAISVIRQRVDASGVAEAEITSQGQENIVVALPGRPSQETLDLVRTSAQLRFRPVLTVTAPGVIDMSAAPEGDPAAAPEGDPAAVTDPAGEGAEGEQGTEGDPVEGDPATEGEPAQGAPAEDATDEAADPAAEGAPASTPEEIEAAARATADIDGNGELATTPVTEPTSNSDLAWLTEQVTYDLAMLDCTNPENLTGGLADDPAQPLVTCDVSGQAKYALGPVDVEGTQIDTASSGLIPGPSGTTTGEWGVTLQLGGEGVDQFAETSQRLYGQQPPQNQFGIVLDGLVVSAPSMNAIISDGQASISGSFTRDTAATLANQLNFGSLPLNFEVQSEEQISATLGSEQLRNGLIAGLIGLALVVLYLLFTYRGLSLVAIASLGIAGVIVYLVITLLSWTMGYRLSLPGVAGLIIAVGITADSFIVYFERIRDELREGRTIEAAVQQGWRRARRTILASDAVNLLAAVVLYLLSVGGVRGFAFTLGLTTVIDVVVVFLFTNPIMVLLARTRFFGEGRRGSGLEPASLGVDVSSYGVGRERAYDAAAAAVRGGRTRGAGATRPTGSVATGKARGRGRADATSDSVLDERVPAGVGAGGATATGAAAGERAADPDRPLTIAERRAAQRRAEAEQAGQAGLSGDPAGPAAGEQTEGETR